MKSSNIMTKGIFILLGEHVLDMKTWSLTQLMQDQIPGEATIFIWLGKFKINILLFIYSLPVKFVKNPRETRMYEGLEKSAWEFEKKNMTYNSHRFGISPKTFKSD